jgi:hypothetical protein
MEREEYVQCCPARRTEKQLASDQFHAKDKFKRRGNLSATLSYPFRYLLEDSGSVE